MLELAHLVTKVVPWIAGITAIGLVVYCTSRVVRFWGSDSWTLTSGKIEKYDKPSHMNSGSGTCFTQVHFSYEVDGNQYSGTWLTPILRNLEALNQFLARELPPGKAVSVRYKPGNPGRSVLVDGPELLPEPVVMQTGFNA